MKASWRKPPEKPEKSRFNKGKTLQRCAGGPGGKICPGRLLFRKTGLLFLFGSDRIMSSKLTNTTQQQQAMRQRKGEGPHYATRKTDSDLHALFRSDLLCYPGAHAEGVGF